MGNEAVGEHFGNTGEVGHGYMVIKQQIEIAEEDKEYDDEEGDDQSDMITYSISFII